MLSRRLALGVLTAPVLAPRAFARARHVYDLEPVSIADGVWMIEGSTDYFSSENGGAIVNIALLRGESGMILVDSGPSLRYGEALVAVVKRLDSRGVSAVLNTHHHPDHFFGNQVFTDTPILALGATRNAALEEGDAFSDNMYRILGDWMRGTEVVPPTEVLQGGDVTVDGRDFVAMPLAGHTLSDLAVLDKATGLLIGGDLVFHNRAPTTPSADIAKWRESLDELETVDAAAVLPGHGPLDRQGVAIQQTRDYLDWLDKALRDAVHDGFDMVEVMGTTLPPEFAALGAQPEEFQRSVSHLFPDIEIEELPRGN